MTVTITTMQVITKEHTTAARALLKEAGVKATVRKGNGSCRWTMTVTTTLDHRDITIETLHLAGFEHRYTDNWRIDGKCQVRFYKPAN